MGIREFRARSQKALGENRALTLVEVLVALAIIAAGIVEVIPFSSTPVLLLFGWLMLWLRGAGWRDVGLRRPENWRRAILIGVAVGVAYQFFSLYVVEPLLARMTGELPDVSQFAPLVGNALLFLLSLVVSWTLAAFVEELAYRGYLMSRVADLFGEGRAGWLLSLLLVSVLFGLAHLYQGTSGIVANIFNGLVYGALYLLMGRNLWAAIIAHGMNDTVGFALIYAGSYPGL